MTWQQTYSIFIDYANTRFPIDFDITTTPIIISAINDQFPNNSYSVGIFKPITVVSGIGIVANGGYKIYNGSQLIDIPLIDNSSYQAEFYPYKYVRNLILAIYEDL